MTPLRPPNVEAATNSGMIHAITPSIRSANVCKHTHTHSHNDAGLGVELETGLKPDPSISSIKHWGSYGVVTRKI